MAAQGLLRCLLRQGRTQTAASHVRRLAGMLSADAVLDMLRDIKQEQEQALALESEALAALLEPLTVEN